MRPHTSRLALAAAIGLATAALPVCAAEDAGKCEYIEVGALPIRYVGLELAPAVQGIIDGTPATMLIATGSERTYLTTTGTERRGLRLRMTGGYMDGLANSTRVYWTRLKEFSIGPARAGNRTELPVIGQFGFTPTYDAIVGANFLLQADMELSLRDMQLRFYRPRDCAGTPLTLWNEATVVVPFESTRSGDTNPHFTVLLNGHKLDAVINTGSSASSITLAAARRMGMRLDAPGVKRLSGAVGVGKGSAAMWSAPLGALSIAGETIKDGEINIIDADGGHSDMTLGQDFLRAHRVLFAMSQKKLYIAYLGGQPFGRPVGVDTWILQEAESGNPDAQFQMSRMYATGGLVPKNTAQAATWLNKAVAQGHPQANLEAGRSLISAGQHAQAAERLRAAMDKLPSDRYGALWLYLARTATGKGELGRQELEKHAAAYQDKAWPVPIADFYLGRIDKAKLLEQAGEEADPKARTCDAVRYIAAWRRAQRDKTAVQSTLSAYPQCAGRADEPH